MTQAGIIDVRGLSLSAASSAAVERFDALIDVSAGVATHWGPQTPGYAHFLSAHAFAMEEAGQYAVAERCAREALALQPQDLWALHGLTRVFEMQGRTQEGVGLLSDAAPFLKDYNLFRGHLWWHLSLFKISQSRFDEVLDLFDREIYPQSSTFYLDVQNGASLLAPGALGALGASLLA